MNRDNASKKIVCRTIDGKHKEVTVDKLSFRPSVYSVIIQDSNILLVPQWGDGYDFPGGGVDLGELLLDTLIREVKEETGFDVVSREILDVQDDFFIHPYSKKALQTPLIFYLCEITGGELSDKRFDEYEKEYAKKAEWIPLKQAPTLTFYNPIDSPKLIEKAVRIQGLLG